MNNPNDRAAYHHGDLRAAILGEAAAPGGRAGRRPGVTARVGPERGRVARRTGAPLHRQARAVHRTGHPGLSLLADALIEARGDFADAALAYVRFAIEHPGHYQVMFNKSLLDASDAELVAAEAASGAELSRGVATLRDRNAKADPAGAQLAAWSLVHGFSMLWLNDAVNAQVREMDPMDTVMRIATMLFAE